MSPLLNLRNNPLTVSSSFEAIDRTEVATIKVHYPVIQVCSQNGQVRWGVLPILLDGSTAQFACPELSGTVCRNTEIC